MTSPGMSEKVRAAAEELRDNVIALADWQGRFEIRADTRLTPLEVELHWLDGFDRIDLAGDRLGVGGLEVRRPGGGSRSETLPGSHHQQVAAEARDLVLD